MVSHLGFMVHFGVEGMMIFDLYQCGGAQFVLGSCGVGGGRCMLREKINTAIYQRARKMWRQDGSPTGRLDDYIEHE